MNNVRILFLMICVAVSIHAEEPSQNRVLPEKLDTAKIPDNLLGVFSNDRDKLNHVTALWFLLQDGPLDVSLVKGNTFEFMRWEPSNDVDAEHVKAEWTGMMDFDYQYCFDLNESPLLDMNMYYTGCIPFTLNKKVSFNPRYVPGKAHQVMFTLVEGAIRAVIQSPSECGFRKTLMSFVPKPGGIAVSFNGEPETLYTQALPVCMFGAFQLDANSTLIEAANDIFRTFSHGKDNTLWTNVTSIWISKTPIHKENEFLFKIAFSPEKVLHRDYRLINGTLLEFNALDNNLHQRRSAEQAAINGNSIVVKIRTGQTDSLTFRYAFYPDYILQTVEFNNKTKVVLTYNRTVPWHLHGTYEEIKENATRQVRPEGDMTMTTASLVPPKYRCNQNRRIRMFPDSTAPHVVLQDTSCTNRTFRFRLSKDLEESKNVTGFSSSLYHRTVTNGRMHLATRYAAETLSIDQRTAIVQRNNESEAASSSTFEHIRIASNPDHDYMDYSSTKESQQSGFRRVMSPSVFGKFRLTGSQAPEDHVWQIIQGPGDRFHFMLPAFPTVFNLTFNKAAETLPGIQSMWHYVEMFDKVILTIYETSHPGSLDFTRKAAYLASPDGVTVTEFESGSEMDVNLTRVV